MSFGMPKPVLHEQCQVSVLNLALPVPHRQRKALGVKTVNRRQQLGSCGQIPDHQDVKRITWQATVNSEETAVLRDRHASDSSGNGGNFFFKVCANVLLHTPFLCSSITAPAGLYDPEQGKQWSVLVSERPFAQAPFSTLFTSQ